MNIFRLAIGILAQLNVIDMGIIAPLLAIGGAALNLIGQSNASKKVAEGRKAFTDYYNTEYYRDPENSIGTRALIKARNERREEAMDAMNNRAAAGGATMENQLAQRKVMNQSDSEFDSNLLMSQEQRRQSLAAQKMQADQQAYAQDAQNWSNWGATMSNALTSLGAISMLGGGSAIQWPKVSAVKGALGQNVLGSVSSSPALNNGIINPNMPGIIGR